jgi:cell division septation protein DedD
MCAQCETTFEVVMLDGEVKTVLPLSTALPQLETTAAPQDYAAPIIDIEPETAVSSAASHTALAAAGDVLSIPHEPSLDYPAIEDAQILEDVFVAPLPQQFAAPEETAAAKETAAPEEIAAVEETAAFEETLAARVEAAEAAAPAEDAEEFAPRLPQEREPETFAELPLFDDAAEPQENRPVAGHMRPAANLDRYALGVRLMRVSPRWLLACSVVFISVIVFCNWITRPTALNDGVATKAATPPVAAPEAIAERSVEAAPADAAQASEPVAAEQVASAPPAPVEEIKAAPAPVAEPTPEVKPTPEIKPTPEVKPLPAIAAPAARNEGNLTLQIGSYNDAEQANDRIVSLRKAGFEARVVRAEIPKRGTWYRVQAGRFTDRSEAASYGAQLRARGMAENFIVTEYQSQP